MKNLTSLILVIVLLSGCRAAYVKKSDLQAEIPVREFSIQSVLWQQHSAEYKALCYQAFNLAQMQLDILLQEKKNAGKPLAIVTDIDETVLDNSPYSAKQIETDQNYSKENWVNWGILERAKAVPGALSFFKHAHSKGIEIFYISNRYNIQQKETMKNLEAIGFPSVNAKHVLLKTTTSEKEARRQTVLKDYEIVMLLGDNLSDFDELFDNKSTSKRNQLVKDLKTKFGKEFIVLPNPMYGDWETKGIYEGNYKWSNKQKDSIRKAKLIAY